MLNRTNTKKLFYKKYLYRIQIYNSLGFYFRPRDSKNLDTLLADFQIEIDKLLKPVLPGDKFTLGYRYSTRDVTFESIQNAHKYSAFFNNTVAEYKVRVEGPWVFYYTNSEVLIDEIANISMLSVVEITKPDLNNIVNLQNGKLVVSSDYKDFKYKATFDTVSEIELPKWIKQNNDLFSMTTGTAKYLEEGGQIGTMTLYIKNDTALTMLQLRINSKMISLYELAYA